MEHIKSSNGLRVQGKSMIGAVDIGGTKIAVGVVDDNGKVLARAETPTDPDNYGAGLDAIGSMLRQTEHQSGAKLRGIGIGSTGPIDPIRGEFGDVDFLPGWRGKGLVRDLENRSSCALLSKTMVTPPPWPKPVGERAAIARG